MNGCWPFFGPRDDSHHYSPSGKEAIPPDPLSEELSHRGAADVTEKPAPRLQDCNRNLKIALARRETRKSKCLLRRTVAPIPAGVTLLAAGDGITRRAVDGPDFERRNAPRFPIHLEVTFKTAMEEFQARTIDISASGILVSAEGAVQVDSAVEFMIEMSAEALGTQRPMMAKCRGRTVRCSEDASGWSVAVAIDEYEFVLPNSAE